jgi:predicted ATPase
MTLNRLSHSQIERMTEQVAGGKTLPAEVIQQLVEKTDGVPLFVEEMTKSVLESGMLEETDGHYELVAPSTSLTIPATLQDSLMARLDRLMTAKVIAQLSATIGRQFSYELLHAVSQVDEETLHKELSRLVEAELVYQRGLPPQATYMFKHALIRDAAYQSLLKSTRQQYHRQIAEVLEERFPETTETQPELLAYHCTEAGLTEQAVGYWQKAGEKAVQRSANVEAIAHLNKGLALLKTLPDTPERIRHELDLRIALGPPLIATKGYTVPEVGRTYARARDLCRHIGETPQLFPVLRGLGLFYFVRAELQTARELGEQLLSLARRQHDSVLLLVAHVLLGQTLLQLGEFALAHLHLKQEMAFDPERQQALAIRYGVAPGVQSLIFTAQALWFLGYPDQTMRKGHEALELVRKLSHPHTLALVQFQMARLHLLRREAHAAQEQAEATMILSTEQGFPLWLAAATFLRGQALAEQGQGEEGMAQMQQGMTATLAQEAEVFRLAFCGWLAEAYAKMGRAEEGLRMLDKALATVDESEHRIYETEMHRLKGELLLQRSPDNHTEAETCYHKALDVAQSQQAKSWELRAATSLSRLWMSQGKRDEARQLLGDVYGWFTEGHDTADLKDAKALLDELS